MRQDQKGMSIIELLVASSLTAIVALGAATTIYTAEKTSRFATIQNDIDRVHYLNLQIARNATNIQKLYGLPLLGQDIDSLSPTAQKLFYCLQMNPNQTCPATGDGNPFGPHVVTDADVNAHLFPALGKVNNVSSTVTVTPHCSVNSCDYISLVVTTTYAGTNSGNSFSVRESKSNLPNFLFVPRNEIDYDATKCANPGEILVGIDFYNQKAICSKVKTWYGGSNTGAGDSWLPLRWYDSGSADLTSPANITECPYGYVTAGFGSGACRASADLTAATAPTTTQPSNVPSNCDMVTCATDGQHLSSTGDCCAVMTPSGNNYQYFICHKNGDGSWTVQFGPMIAVTHSCM